ncbi:NAD(P)/FAD-dependent oxidoreductase [Nitrincola sp. MINF-07-Sa-05]|uniref:NAD(P)/FAD-dependent oxidoreductase n=1 Tax=Nitrincola salilacus TaxID=3400273 RepID=UPI003917BEE7
MERVDVIIIGAGPSGACAGALLARAGKRVLCIEKQHFPRFSIGESLLPHCMEFLASAGLLDAVEAGALEHGFQFKDGAAFLKQGQHTEFDFTKKSSPGPGTTYQVKRAAFDQLLADAASKQGMEIRYGEAVESLEYQKSYQESVALSIRKEGGENYRVQAGFVLDASGFGRVLPRLLDLEEPSNFPVRQANFCHIKDQISDPAFDRNKILITVHPTQQDVWFWLIPFSDGTASLGVVGCPERFNEEQTSEQKLWEKVHDEPDLSALLSNATMISEARDLTGYSANVRSLYGKRYALLGNAGEFLDPVFSSGVTIALRSSEKAVPLVLRELDGENVDWEVEYSVPLRKGINTFRCFVEAWYDGRFQNIIFNPDRQPEISAMISSILAGYAWDQNNPYVAETSRRIQVLSDLCSDSLAS